MAPVIIYTRQFCGYCARAKSLLEEKGIDYVEHDATFFAGPTPGDDWQVKWQNDIPADIHRRAACWRMR